jgi:sugar/nucleoside kinase (ribokinase family)
VDKLVDNTALVDNAVDIACAGIVVADCVARPVHRQPQPGLLEFVDEIGLYAGGSAASTGTGLVRLGARVALIGRIGQDGFGDFLAAEARRVGCDATLLKRDATTGTSSSLVTVTPDGERAFLHAIGANARLVPDDIPIEALHARGCRVLHLAGYFALPGMQGNHGEPARDVFANARALGITTSLDCVWDGAGRWGSLIDAVLEHTDLFCPSIHEARAIVALPDRATPLEIAQGLFAKGVREAVALKMGPDGSFVMNASGEHHRVPAPQVVAVDGTGAGDAFIAGFLAARLRGLDLPTCAQIGNATGALCVTAMGATAGVTGWDAVAALSRTVG